MCRPKKGTPAEERFWAKVDKSGDCWEWTGSKTEDGYGVFMSNGRQGRAHRFSYTLAKGAIADGMVIMHSCDNPPCVNPAHLSAGTVMDNIRDKLAKGRQTRSCVFNTSKTHCARGHEYSPENTRVDKNGWRACKTCERIKSLARYYRQRDEINAKHNKQP